MREKLTKGVKVNMINNVVVRMEKSGNRYNAYDADGNKYTSEIGTSTRRSAFEKVWRLKSVQEKVVEPIGGKFQ